MIVKTSKGYVVKSESGRNLSKPLPSKKTSTSKIKTSGTFQIKEIKGELTLSFSWDMWCYYYLFISMFKCDIFIT